MNQDDWRFQGFQRGSMDKPHSATLAVPTSSFATQNFQSQYGGTNAASRVGSPSGTNWGATFSGNSIGANNPASPSGTDWGKTFRPTWAGNNQPSLNGNKNAASRFSLNLSPVSDRSSLSLDDNDTLSFHRSRLSSFDLTKKDHDLYGAGSEYGFAY